MRSLQKELTLCHPGAEAWQPKMSSQHLASISDSATDILVISLETFKLWVLNCWEKLALWLPLPVGTER